MRCKLLSLSYLTINLTLITSYSFYPNDSSLPLINDTVDSNKSILVLVRNTALQIQRNANGVLRPLDAEIDIPAANTIREPFELHYKVADVTKLFDSHEHAFAIDRIPAVDNYAVFRKWLASPISAVTVPPWSSGIRNSSKGITCGILYEIFFNFLGHNARGSDSGIGEDPGLLTPEYTALLAELQSVYFSHRNSLAKLYGWNLNNRSAPIPFEVKCPIYIDGAAFLDDQFLHCSNPYFSPTIDNWNLAQTDDNLAFVLRGSGADSNGVWWQGPDLGFNLSTFLGQLLYGIDNFRCSLESKCHIDLDCTKIGSHNALGLGYDNKVLPSRWGYLTMYALSNINDQLSNQYVAIKGAAIRAILETFNIDDFFPKKNQGFSLRNVLLGLGTTLAVIAGFAPTVSSVSGAAGALLPAVGGFLGNEIARTTDPNVVQKTFAPKLEEIYYRFVNALNNLTTTLFEGGDVNGINIRTVMKNGSWINPRSLSKVSEVETQLKVEIMSRSIDALWKTKTSNKMWVLYVNLTDNDKTQEKCKNDTSGPVDLRYCAEKGVYYTYNYVEDGDLEGHVDYPWGIDKLAGIGIDMKWITEASAKTFRLAKKPESGLDPFNLSANDTTLAYISNTVKQNRPVDLRDLAGRYPGSWTLPVCETSNWGGRWNFNIKNQTGLKLRLNVRTDRTYGSSIGSPPCICGVNGTDTVAWVKAAGMHGFLTYYKFCKMQLESPDFTWPDNVRCVDYTFGDVIKKPGIKDC